MDISQESLKIISDTMTLSNKSLQESPSKRFERTFREMIQQEIFNGVNAAESFKDLIPGATAYTHTNVFPLAVYEQLTKENLIALENNHIYLSKNAELKEASICIIFHF